MLKGFNLEIEAANDQALVTKPVSMLRQERYNHCPVAGAFHAPPTAK